mmetsp:Transcript_146340/g.469465  ORF Transcript_146340/g.469465 Transcript_146340/m.469465 type:complete len:124 (+) Transcript_146340:81-452(+)
MDDAAGVPTAPATAAVAGDAGADAGADLGTDVVQVELLTMSGRQSFLEVERGAFARELQEQVAVLWDTMIDCVRLVVGDQVLSATDVIGNHYQDRLRPRGPVGRAGEPSAAGGTAADGDEDFY